jgi:hypothetical protein
MMIDVDDGDDVDDDINDGTDKYDNDAGYETMKIII